MGWASETGGSSQSVVFILKYDAAHIHEAILSVKDFCKYWLVQDLIGRECYCVSIFFNHC